MIQDLNKDKIKSNCFLLSISKPYSKKAVITAHNDVPAELAKRVICACIREICFFRDRVGPKSHKFSWSLLTRHLYTRQLACEPQIGSVACLSFAVRNGTKKTTSSLD